MIEPIATRLRSLLQENPGRSGTSSLVMTGHSAGGAVAALLYAHMMSVEVHSELTALVPFLKRIHCITFGAPPVTLLPLMAERQGHAPDRAENEREEHGRRNRKSLFFSFINEGDPVARADKTVVASLLKLHALPAPVVSKAKPLAAMAGRKKQAPNWMVPPGTLSNAGRLVLLRLPLLKEARESSVEACLVTDDQLRTVIFGDPSLHSMKLYARRIETLATRAVTGRAGAAS